MSFALGLKAIHRLCADQQPLAWHKAKLSPGLFKPFEQDVYAWVAGHVEDHHALPHLTTLGAMFPDMEVIETPEPASYYVQQLEQRYFYDQLTGANLASQAVLKDDPSAYLAAMTVLRKSIREITEQQYRQRILDVGKEAPALVLMAYYQQQHAHDHIAAFGWPHLDATSGGVMPGDVISFVGRPAVGKTWLTLWTALHNWRERKLNVLYVSMEMTTLPITQRIVAMYTKQNIAQLKVAGYSTPTMQKFVAGLKGLVAETAKFYVVDGNLATSVEDLFSLAEMLECKVVFIDGAYLLRHKNLKLDRYTRAAENVELIKRQCTDQEMMAFCSWQFNREASKKQKKGDQGDLEDIGYSDAIGQISSIALSLYQEESVETMKERKVRILKGRNGEVGQFTIAWDFQTMGFHQIMTDDVVPHQQDMNEFCEWV